jgi:nitrate/nitrite transporter NarK
MVFRRLLAIFRYRNLLGICIGFFCFDYFWYVILFWLTDFLVNTHKMPLRRAGFYAAITYLISGVAEPVGGWIADRLIRHGWGATRTRKGIVTIAFLCGLLIIPAAAVRNAPLAVALMFGVGLVGLSAGNLHVILQSCAPPHEVSVWTGIENFAGNFAGALAMLVMGWTLGRTGSYLPGFAFASIVLVLGSLSYMFIVGELKPPAPRNNER